MADTSKLADLHATLEVQLEEAYRRGHRDGCAETRDQILRTLGVSDTALGLDRTLEQLNRDDRDATRVERGAVRAAVEQVVSGNKAGLTIAEIGRNVTALDPRIAETSVANELRRNKGKRYRRSRSGRWTMIEDELPETEGPAVADDDRPAGSMLNGSAHDEATITTSGSA